MSSATSQTGRRILEFETIVRSERATLELDFRAASTVDSMGLNLLVSIIRYARNRGSKVVGHVVNTNVQRAIYFTRLNTRMDLIAA